MEIFLQISDRIQPLARFARPREPLERSALLHTLAGGNGCTLLTECRRGDRRLFDFYASLIAGGPRAELRDRLRRRSLQPGYITPEGGANQFFAQPRRGAVACRIPRSVRSPGARTWITVHASLARPRGLRLHFGGAKGYKERVPVHRGERRRGGAEHKARRGGGRLELRASECVAAAGLAQTYASCKGTEFSGSLRLWDCTHKFFTRRHLFVGLSRARQEAEVSLRD
jgi:hypothetical protein